MVKVCIIGMGLIGGSLGIALKKSSTKIRVIGVVRRKKNIAKALAKRAADEVLLDPCKAVQDADWIILATNPRAFEPLLKKLRPHLRQNQIVTDVGSVKQPVMKIYRRILGNHVSYIGAHPIAGSEREGIEAARADLFKGATSILTPDRNTSSKTLGKAIAFWKSLRMKPVVMTDSQHDKIFALLSHLPHLLSFTLLKTARGLVFGKKLSFQTNDERRATNDVLSLAGEAWRDMTRVAMSPSELWIEIFQLNRSQILKSLHRFLKNLHLLESAVQKSDTIFLRRFFENARRSLEYEQRKRI